MSFIIMRLKSSYLKSLTQKQMCQIPFAMLATKINESVAEKMNNFCLIL